MNTRRTVRALALLVAFAAPLPEGAAAQTKADAFAGKIPPVSGQLYRKAGRFELSATGNLSLNDAFFTKYFGGAKLGYHFNEFISGAVHASGGTATRSGSAVVCNATTCRDPSELELRQVPGRIRGIVGAEIAWSPVYGKLNVLAERVAHFDLSIMAGPDAILHDEVLPNENLTGVTLAQANRTPGTQTTIGGHIGLGARVFVREWVALRLEVKDYVYGVEVPNNGSGKDWQHQIFTELGVSFFFPTRNRTTR